MNERLVEMKTSQYNIIYRETKTVFENLNFSDNVGGGAVPMISSTYRVEMRQQKVADLSKQKCSRLRYLLR